VIRSINQNHATPATTFVRKESVQILEQAVGGRPPRYAPPLSSLCGRRSASRWWGDRNVAVVSYGQYVPTLTAAAAWRVNTAMSKAAWWPWPLTFWPWKWCPSHVWRGLPPSQFYRSLCSRLKPDVHDRRQTSDSQTDVRQHHRFMPRLLGAGHNNQLNYCQILLTGNYIYENDIDWERCGWV